MCCSLPLATQQTKSACDTTKQPQQLPGSPYKHAHVRTELDNMSEVADEEPVEHLKKKNMNFMNVHQVRHCCC